MITLIVFCILYLEPFNINQIRTIPPGTPQWVYIQRCLGNNFQYHLLEIFGKNNIHFEEKAIL